MKKNTFISLIVLSILSCLTVLPLFAKSTKNNRSNQVIVYTYDSFAGEWGPGPELIEKFKKATGYDLVFIDCGDAVEAYNRALSEKDNVQADVVLGIDNNLYKDAISSGILKVYKPKNADKVLSDNLEEQIGGDYHLTPYDYSHFAIIYDTQSNVPAPESLEDLTKDIYKKKIILMDPRTSTPGLGFASWTISVFGEKYPEYWSALKPNILSMTPGWSAGWGMFSSGEAPLVISYTTSPAYTLEEEGSDRYKALIFDEGHVMQVEGYGLLNNAPNEKGAKAFMDFMITESAQETLLFTQWMYPANKNVKIPESYNKASPVPSKTLKTETEATSRAVNKIISIVAK